MVWRLEGPWPNPSPQSRSANRLADASVIFDGYICLSHVVHSSECTHHRKASNQRPQLFATLHSNNTSTYPVRAYQHYISTCKTIVAKTSQLLQPRKAWQRSPPARASACLLQHTQHTCMPSLTVVGIGKNLPDQEIAKQCTASRPCPRHTDRKGATANSPC